jgi:hypothetical protein
MIYGLPISFEHITLINRNDMSLLKYPMVSIFPRAADQAKKALSKELWFAKVLNTLSKKRNAIMTDKDAVKGANIEHPFV